jgi:hypothetical protein
MLYRYFPYWFSSPLPGCRLYSWGRICKRLWSPEIDSKESIQPAYVAWRAGTTNRVVVPARLAGNRFLGSFKGLQIRTLAPTIRLSVSIYLHSLIKLPTAPTFRLSVSSLPPLSDQTAHSSVSFSACLSIALSRIYCILFCSFFYSNSSHETSVVFISLLHHPPPSPDNEMRHESEYILFPHL